MLLVVEPLINVVFYFVLMWDFAFFDNNHSTGTNDDRVCSPKS